MICMEGPSLSVTTHQPVLYEGVAAIYTGGWQRFVREGGSDLYDVREHELVRGGTKITAETAVICMGGIPSQSHSQLLVLTHRVAVICTGGAPSQVTTAVICVGASQ